MSTFELVRQGWFSWNFTVLQNGAPTAEIHISSGSEKGELEIAGATYQVYRERLMSGLFILELDGTRIATAEKPSAFSRSFNLLHDNRSYLLKAASSFGREFLLLDREFDRQLGSIRPAGIFTWRAIVDLPDELPLPFRVFVLWLTLVLWKRQAEQ